MTEAYDWQSADDFLPAPTDVVISVVGSKDSISVFLRNLGVKDKKWPTEDQPAIPRRLRNHHDAQSRVVLVVLSPTGNSDMSIAVALESLEKWLGESYRNECKTNMHIAGFLWLVKTISARAGRTLSQGSLELLQKNFKHHETAMKSTHPIMLHFNPTGASNGTPNPNPKTLEDIKNVFKVQAGFDAASWIEEGDGTPRRMFELLIAGRAKRKMIRLRNSKEHRSDDVIIAVMGATGTGKTNLISKARDSLCPDSSSDSKQPEACDALKSGTKEIIAYRIINHPTYGDRVVLLDTPGFDDSTQDDGKILERIAEWLKETYHKFQGILLTGILYVSRINDNRATGTALRSLKLLGNVCGNHAAANVMLISTHWDRMKGQDSRAEERLEEYKTKFWKKLIDLGSQHFKFLNDCKSIEDILLIMIDKHRNKKITVLLDELVRLEKDVKETGAGKAIREDQKRAIAALQKEYEELMKTIPTLQDESLKEEIMKEAEKTNQVWQHTTQSHDAFKPEKTGLFRKMCAGVRQMNFNPLAPKAVKLGEE